MGKAWDRLWDNRGNAAEQDVNGYIGSDGAKRKKTTAFSQNMTRPTYQAGYAAQAWHEAWAREAIRVLRPGGFLLAFGGTRTVHRLTCAIEDAGFEIRDTIQWIYGSGFPKSANISKHIDRMAGAEREVVGQYEYPDGRARNCNEHTTKRNGIYSDIKTDDSLNNRDFTAPATEEAKQWEGWGTALKPAHEPICVARKPLSESSVARNVLKWGTGGLNIEQSRVGLTDYDLEEYIPNRVGWKDGIEYEQSGIGKGYHGSNNPVKHQAIKPSGRFPSNLLLSHHPLCRPAGVGRVKGNRAGGVAGRASTENWRFENHVRPGYADPDGFERVTKWECARDDSGFICPIALLDEQGGVSKSTGGNSINTTGWMTRKKSKPNGQNPGFGDEGGPNRFYATFPGEWGAYYQAKAATSERWVRLKCNCETVKLPSWDNADQSQNGTTEPTSPRRDTSENNIGKMESSERDSFIPSCGKSTTEQSPKDSKFTTLTGTSSTTESRTSDSSPQPSISGCTADASSGTANGGSRVASAKNSSPSPLNTGTYPPKGGPYTGAVVPATYAKSLATSKCGSCGKTPKTEGHPTQKPVKLLSYLIKLVTPPNGTVLDCFAGSGSTLVAAAELNINAVGIEQSAEYCEIMRRRVAFALEQQEESPEPTLFEEARL